MGALKYNFPDFDWNNQVKFAHNKANEPWTRLDIFSFVLDQSNEIVLVTDENTNIVVANKKACELLGYTQDELLTMRIRDIAPHIKEEVLVQFPQICHHSDGSLIIEIYYQNKAQQSFPVEVKISPFIASHCYFSFVAIDLSSKTHELDLLRHNEKEFVAFLESSHDIVVRFDLFYRFIYVNEAFETNTGYSRCDIIDKYFGESGLLSEEQAQLIINNLNKVIESGNPIEFDFFLTHAMNGWPLYWKIIAIPEHDKNNKISGIICAVNDISELKIKEKELVIAKERAEENSKMKSFFLATISHEIRTPLNAIIGLSQLLKDETLAREDHDEFIDLIDESGMKLIHSIEEILDLAKIASCQLEFESELCNANTIIKYLYLDINQKLSSKQKATIGISIELMDNSLINLPFYSDVKLIKQVLNILLSNALKFTKEGEIKLGVLLADHEKIIFYVSDTGIGIPVEKHESIFEPFVQADISMRRSYEGLGIGLTLARRIARALGGDITLVSAPGEGSTFSFTLLSRQKEQVKSKKEKGKSKK